MSSTFNRSHSFTTSTKNKSTQENPPEKTILFYGELKPQQVPKSPRISTARNTGPNFLRIPTSLTKSEASIADSIHNNSMTSLVNKSENELLDDNAYALLDNPIHSTDHDYHDRIYTMRKSEYTKLMPPQPRPPPPPKLENDPTNLAYFKLQRTNSYYEMFEAIKRRTKFPPTDPPPPSAETAKLVEFVDFTGNYNCVDKRKKVDNGRGFASRMTQLNEESMSSGGGQQPRQVIKSNKNKKPILTMVSNESPLLETYKEIVKKSIDQNIEKIKKNKEKAEDKQPAEKKYYHLLDQLLDYDKENKDRQRLKLNSKVPHDYDNDYEPVYYDNNLNKSENWLLKWSIVRGVTTKNLLEIFQKNDTAKKGNKQFYH